MPKPKPYDRVQRDGCTLNARTDAMIRYVIKLLRERGHTFAVIVGQGSYNAGGVAASAGTHDRGGVADFRVRHLTTAQRVALVKALKAAGFAVWFRPACASWPAHIHAVAIADRELAPVAARQVTAYDAGRDGLTSNRKDATYRPSPRVVFAYTQDKPIPRV